MQDTLFAEFFRREDIKYYSSLSVSDCAIMRPDKLPMHTSSVIFFLIPYYVKDDMPSNISLYAVPRDYHLYIKELEERLNAAILSSDDTRLRIFADNSPFDERICAEKAGLGKKGRNGLVMCREYGSFVFIGSICLPYSISISQKEEYFNSDICENCEKCVGACPISRKKCTDCVSNITQKKRITPDEAEIISSSDLKWGCDICQRVCPINRAVSETPIDFFRTHRVPYITSELIELMDDAAFSERAYSWRGRSVILRNLNL